VNRVGQSVPQSAAGTFRAFFSEGQTRSSASTFYLALDGSLSHFLAVYGLGYKSVLKPLTLDRRATRLGLSPTAIPSALTEKSVHLQGQ
jgi:hypothetical protein